MGSCPSLGLHQGRWKGGTSVTWRGWPAAWITACLPYHPCPGLRPGEDHPAPLQSDDTAREVRCSSANWSWLLKAQIHGHSWSTDATDRQMFVFATANNFSFSFVIVWCKLVCAVTLIIVTSVWYHYCEKTLIKYNYGSYCCYLTWICPCSCPARCRFFMKWCMIDSDQSSGYRSQSQTVYWDI